MNRSLANSITFKRSFLGVFLLGYTYLMLYTIPDYGLTWDAWEYYVGDMNLNFYRTLDATFLDYRTSNLKIYQEPGHPEFYLVSKAQEDELDVFQAPHLIWPFGHTISSITKYLFYGQLDMFDPIDAHHLSLIAFGIAVISIVYIFVYRYFGKWEAVFAVFCLTIHPRYWAHMHNNLKDFPISVLFTIVVILFVHGFTTNRAAYVYCAAIACGVAMATKANILFAPVILGPWLVYRLNGRRKTVPELDLAKWFSYLFKNEHREMSKFVPRNLAVALCVAPIIVVFVMLLCWPLLAVDFPKNLTLYISSLFDRGLGSHSGWNRMPAANFVFTLPLAIMFLFVLGLLRITIAFVRQRRLDGMHLLVLLWFSIPLLRVSLPGARDFDGIRHWLEIIPPTAIVAGLGGGWLVCILQRQFTRSDSIDTDTGLSRYREPACGFFLIILLFSPLFGWHVNAHPNNLVYYNRLIGGLAGAQARGLEGATDYWGSSYRQGFEWLYDNKDIPADSELYVGVAQHIAFYTREIWLRRDIRLRPFTGISEAQLNSNVARSSGHTYVMYITREPWYPPLLKKLDSTYVPVYEITIDGGTILKILRLK